MSAAPVLARRAAQNGALAPFQVRSFRLLWPAELATSWALEMEALILGWYILTETGSVLVLVLFGALLYFGTLVSPFFGLAGDRFGYRNVLCFTRAITASLAATLLALTATGSLAPTAVLLIAGLASMTRSSDLVVRYAVTAVVMPPPLLMGAMGVSRATVDSARVAGALAGAGMVAAFGMTPAYVFITALYVTSFALTLFVRDERRAAAPAPSGADRTEPAGARGIAAAWRELAAAFAYVRTEPALLAAISVAFLINLTAYPLSMGLLPYVAKVVYGAGQTGLGYLSAGFAFGSLVGSLAVSATRIAARAARVMVVSVVLWLLTLLAFAHAPNLPAAVALLGVAGFMQSLCVTPLAVVMLRIAHAEIRGRVMGLRMLAIYGLPIGLMASGPVIEAVGFLATLTLYAAIGLLATTALAWRWRASVWRANAPANTPASTG